EAVTGEKISVDAPFFNRVNIPIGLFLLLLTGVGPLIAWRRSSVESLKKAFFWPALAALVLATALVTLGVRHFYATVSLALCAFVATTVILEFFKGANAIRSKSGTNLVAAMVELTHRNTRRYGGYLVHMGIVLLFIGFTGAAFNVDSTVEVAKGDSFKLGGYQLTVRDIVDSQTDDYVARKATVEV